MIGPWLNARLNIDGRIDVKLPNGRYVPRARAVWEWKHGPIPKGMVIHHVDHNILNDDPDNLAMMTKFAHGRLHGLERRSRGYFPSRMYRWELIEKGTAKSVEAEAKRGLLEPNVTSICLLATTVIAKRAFPPALPLPAVSP